MGEESQAKDDLQQWNLEYGKLATDEKIVSTIEELKGNLIEVQKCLRELLPIKNNFYDKMSLPEQIELDLCLVYTLNSLQWINLRIQGIDPMQHPIKDELKRIKDTMKRWEEVKAQDQRPKVNVEAAKRFVRSGLYDPSKAPSQPLNKKIKFDDSE